MRKGENGMSQGASHGGSSKQCSNDSEYVSESDTSIWSAISYYSNRSEAPNKIGDENSAEIDTALKAIKGEI